MGFLLWSIPKFLRLNVCLAFERFFSYTELCLTIANCIKNIWRDNVFNLSTMSSRIRIKQLDYKLYTQEFPEKCPAQEAGHFFYGHCEDSICMVSLGVMGQRA